MTPRPPLSAPVLNDLIREARAQLEQAEGYLLGVRTASDRPENPYATDTRHRVETHAREIRDVYEHQLDRLEELAFSVQADEREALHLANRRRYDGDAA